MKQKTHEFIIRVSFDKPCSSPHALEALKDCIHGTHYPYQPNYDTDPGIMKIKSFKPKPRKRIGT